MLPLFSFELYLKLFSWPVSSNGNGFIVLLYFVKENIRSLIVGFNRRFGSVSFETGCGFRLNEGAVITTSDLFHEIV